MSNVSKKTLEKIKKEKIRPFSRHWYRAKKATIWILAGLFMILGILATGVVIFRLTHTDWDLFSRSGYGPVEFILFALPYFWLLCLIAFLTVAFMTFRRTEKGYRYRAFVIILSSTLLSVIGGGLLYQSGFSARLESAFFEKSPLYRTLNRGPHRMWTAPERGFLAGTILQIISGKEMVLVDLHGQKWRVDISGAFWRGRRLPEKNLDVKIIGEMLKDHKFVAREVRPMHGRRMYGRGKHRGRHRR